MRDRHWGVILAGLWLLLSGSSIQAGASTQYTGLHSDILIEQQRNTFQLALANHQQNSTIKDYPLFPLLEKSQLEQAINKGPLNRNLANKVQNYLDTYSNSWPAASLRQHWLLKLGAQGKWQLFLEDYNGTTSNIRLDCYHHRAQWASGHKTLAMSAGADLWLRNASKYRACSSLMKQWKKAGNLTTELRWQAILTALDKGQLNQARQQLKKIDSSSQKLAMKLINNWKKPKAILFNFKSDSGFAEATHFYDLQRVYLKKLGKNNAEDAISLIQTSMAKRPPHIQKKVLYNLATSLFYQQHEQSSYWLTQLDPAGLDEKIQQMILRHHLLQQDWAAIAQQINALPRSLKNKHRWQYWSVRADMAANSNLNNQQIEVLKKLAITRDFYGFLAADILKQDYQMQHTAVSSSNKLLTKVQAMPSIQRAFEWYQLNQPLEAYREWHFVLQQLTHNERLAAAQLAHQWGWHNQVVITLAKAKNWDDLDLRFPTPYAENFQQAALNNSILPNWAYAIARQESAFRADAKSPVGARGLMQIMPATARETARKAGIGYNKSTQLYQADKNIKLGNAYLSQLKKRFQGNLIYATAAYNAGPHRVKRWIKQRPGMPIDAWIETIPFKETRRYVQNVMTYTAIYGDKLGTDQRLIGQLLPLTPLISQTTPPIQSD